MSIFGKKKSASLSLAVLPEYDTSVHLNDAYFQAVVKVEMSHLVDDCVSKYRFKDPIFGGSYVYPHDVAGLYEQGVNIQKILFNHFFYPKRTYTKIQLSAGNYLVVDRAPDQNDNITINSQVGGQQIFKAIKTATVRGFADGALIDQLRALVAMLKSIYDGMMAGVNFANKKPIYKMFGFNDRFQALGKDSIDAEEMAIFMHDQVIQVLKFGGIIDSKDDVVYIGPDTNSMMERIMAIYTRWASLLKLPQTSLIGTSPTGLSATGEYDDRRYRLWRNTRQRTVIEPVAEMLDYPYDVIDQYTPLELQEKTEAILNLENIETLVDEEGKKTMIEGLI